MHQVKQASVDVEVEEIHTVTVEGGWMRVFRMDAWHLMVVDAEGCINVYRDGAIVWHAEGGPWRR